VIQRTVVGPPLGTRDHGWLHVHPGGL